MHRAVREFGHGFGRMAVDAVERVDGDGIFNVIDGMGGLLPS